MKKTLLLLIAFSFISSCSSDNDNTEFKSNLFGKWNVTAEYEYIEGDNNSPYIETPKAKEYIYEFSERYLTVHTNDPEHIFSGRQIEYTYYPEDGEMTYFGLKTDVDFDGNNTLILTAYQEDSRNEVHLERIE